MKSTAAIRMAETIIAKYGATPPIPVDVIAESEGAQVDYRDLEDNVSGLLVRKEKNAYIIVNAGHAKNRQRFTIAHELGHFLLHRNDPAIFVDNYFVHFREGGSSDRYDRREVQANAFSANLLMPATSLKADLRGRTIDVSDEDSLKEIASRYTVSSLALAIRLMELGLAVGMPSRR